MTFLTRFKVINNLSTPQKQLVFAYILVYNAIMAKLSTLLKEYHSDHADNMLITQGGNNSVAVVIPEKAFDIPPETGQSVDELVDEAGVSYMRACLEMSHRAMTGNVDPMREGDLPHKMALLLANRMIPKRKWKATLPDDTPEEVKKSSRALKALIKSLSSDATIIVDDNTYGDDSAGRQEGRKAGGRRRAVNE